MTTLRLTAITWLWVLGCACIPGITLAHEGESHDSSDTDALHWLEQQQNAGGEISSAAEIATDFQATAESLNAFTLFDYNQADATAALAYLNSLDASLNTEYLSRRIMALVAAGQDPQAAVDALLERQNDDGGFGHQQDFGSTPLDTAYALNALTAAGSASASVISPAVGYLAAAQAGDGGYAVSYDAPSSVPVTSLVVTALKHYLFSYNVAGTLNAAIDYLYESQDADGGWGTDWETALALQALIPVTTDTSRYQSAVASLTNAQGSEGDWADSPFSTALALAAIRLLSTVTVPADPSKASITGTLVSSDGGGAVSGASIELDNSNVPAEIGNNGSFVIRNLEPGSYQLTYSAPGYLSAVQNLTLREGQLANVGTVRLTVSPTTALVSGQVRDSSTGSAVAGAQVSIDVAGSVFNAATDLDGNYRQTVPAGSANLTVTSAQYYPASVKAELNAGTHTRFSPSLTPISEDEPASASVIGRIVDAESGSGLGGVGISTSEDSVTSAPDGSFELSDLEPGALSIQISGDGYETLGLSIVVPERAIADVGDVALTPIVEQDTTTVSGRITGLSSGEPVPNATVTVGPSSTRTDSNGFYEISGINLLEFEVAVNATGYVFSKKLITLTDHTRVTADILLRRAEVGGVAVSSVTTDKPVYNSYEPVRIVASMTNETAIEQRVRLYVNVVDSAGTLVTSFPAVELPELGDNPSPEEIAHFEEHLAESVEILQPHQEITLELERWWNVGRITPGDYEISVQALDAATSQLTSQLSTAVSVVPTEAIASLQVKTSPEYALIDSSASIEIRVDLFNRSNVPVSSEFGYRLETPSGAVLAEGTTTVNLDPETTNETLVLETVDHTFIESGRYSLEVEILSGAVPGVIAPGEVFVPPTTRIDIQQSVQPHEAAPLEGVEVEINIEVKGVDGEQ